MPYDDLFLEDNAFPWLVDEACRAGVEKRFLGYGCQQIALDVEAMRRIAEVDQLVLVG